MNYPDFYKEVTPIDLYDPLSDFLGALEDGEIEISYLDCVKLAGHSCPTVAGAYLMAQEGLKALYPDETPQRGDIRVQMRDNVEDGVTGVVANIISFIVGAGERGGFKGIKGKFNRANLLSFNADITHDVRLTRLDTDQSISLSYNPSIIETDERVMPLMGKNLQGLASKEEKILFNSLWQERVEKILFSNELYSEMIVME